MLHINKECETLQQEMKTGFLVPYNNPSKNMKYRKQGCSLEKLASTVDTRHLLGGLILFYRNRSIGFNILIFGNSFIKF